MYKCNNCNGKFDEPYKLNTSYENFYGVGNFFTSHTTHLELELCPNCKSEEIEEIDESEEEENV